LYSRHSIIGSVITYLKQRLSTLHD